MDILVKRIFWKRTYLFVEYTSEAFVPLNLYHEDSNKMVSFKIKRMGETLYRGKLNTTMAAGRTLMDEGKWKLNSGVDYCNFKFDCEKGNSNLLNKSFRFSKRVYSCEFRIHIDDILTVNVSYMRRLKNKEIDGFTEKFFDGIN